MCRLLFLDSNIQDDTYNIIHGQDVPQDQF